MKIAPLLALALMLAPPSLAVTGESEWQGSPPLESGGWERSGPKALAELHLEQLRAEEFGGACHWHSKDMCDHQKCCNWCSVAHVPSVQFCMPIVQPDPTRNLVCAKSENQCTRRLDEEACSGKEEDLCTWTPIPGSNGGNCSFNLTKCFRPHPASTQDDQGQVAGPPSPSAEPDGSEAQEPPPPPAQPVSTEAQPPPPPSEEPVSAEAQEPPPPAVEPTSSEVRGPWLYRPSFPRSRVQAFMDSLRRATARDGDVEEQPAPAVTGFVHGVILDEGDDDSGGWLSWSLTA